jgi:hypothetical protein
VRCVQCDDDGALIYETHTAMVGPAVDTIRYNKGIRLGFAKPPPIVWDVVHNFCEK